MHQTLNFVLPMLQSKSHSSLSNSSYIFPIAKDMNTLIVNTLYKQVKAECNIAITKTLPVLDIATTYIPLVLLFSPAALK